MKNLNKRPFEKAIAEIVSIGVSDIITQSPNFDGEEDIFETEQNQE